MVESTLLPPKDVVITRTVAKFGNTSYQIAAISSVSAQHRESVNWNFVWRLAAERHLPNIFDALPLHTVAAAYSGPINTTGHNAPPFKNATHERAATSTQWPLPIKLKVDLRFVHRIFWLCQIGMSIDPIDSISLGSKFPKMVHGPIRPHYLHAPKLAVLH
jgi:hypothetical protein